MDMSCSGDSVICLNWQRARHQILMWPEDENQAKRRQSEKSRENGAEPEKTQNTPYRSLIYNSTHNVYYVK